MAEMKTFIVIFVIMFPMVMITQEDLNHGVCPVPMNKEEEEFIKEREKNRELMEEIEREIEMTCLDECKTGQHNCHEDAYCSNTERSFSCTCKSGYSGDGVNCADINECDTEEHNCDVTRWCYNTKGSFDCPCREGYSENGEDKCTDENECETGKHNCDANATCENNEGSFVCTCKPGYFGNGVNCTPIIPASSCKELYDNQGLTTSRVYTLKFDSHEFSVYCHMGVFGCGDGGWTPVMKIDGTKKTFHYDSHLWSDKNPYNISGGRTGFDSQETKLPSYWKTSFSKICLGMKFGHKIRFVTIHGHANSLYSLIADGRYRATSLGRRTWKSLIGPQASLQYYCNKEGFNAICRKTHHSKARIGITSNNERDCVSCDSRIGFGTGGTPDDTNTCGNEATWSPDNGHKRIKTMGYILVQ